MGVGFQLKAILREKGITIKELSDRTGIPVNTLYSITKRDSIRVDKVILKKIADELGISWYELYPEEKQGQAIIDSILDDLGGKSRVKQRIDKALDKLTEEGMKEAAKRVEELTEIPKYQKSPSEDNQGNGDQE